MNQSVLVINCGSSSIKFALYAHLDEPAPHLTALAERLNEQEPSIRIQGAVEYHRTLASGAGHKEALLAFIESCHTHLQNLKGIGHRVVHGGELFHASTLIDDEQQQRLATLSPLAPLHNPLNVLGIELCRELFGDVPQVAVFDTAFHQTLSEQAYLYGVPYDWYEQDAVRRYGFHGTSYRYVVEETARRLKKKPEDCNLLIAHLGNGCSAAAVLCGRSVDSSMGLTPLEGLIMGSRCGDIDPGLIEHMQRSRGLSLEQTMRDLNRNSGLKGLSGLSNDMRTLLAAEAEGHEGARRAIQVFCFRVARQFSALATSLPTIDAVVFTGGIGEHAAPVRQRILAAWRFMNFRLDSDLNNRHGDDLGRISQPGSPLVLVIPTSEERMIALDTYQLIAAN
ncbi:MAG: acetate kinase [Saccharospirillaceae bacterium]|nr:acetate kinase [Saccharospirillaceae bacterium]MCD8531049.1 acetate kinase [Saccharospirillaceae bacterium]